MQIPCVYIPGPAPAVSVANSYCVHYSAFQYITLLSSCSIFCCLPVQCFHNSSAQVLPYSSSMFLSSLLIYVVLLSNIVLSSCHIPVSSCLKINHSLSNILSISLRFCPVHILIILLSRTKTTEVADVVYVNI